MSTVMIKLAITIIKTVITSWLQGDLPNGAPDDFKILLNMLITIIQEICSLF